MTFAGQELSVVKIQLSGREGGEVEKKKKAHVQSLYSATDVHLDDGLQSTIGLLERHVLQSVRGNRLSSVRLCGCVSGSWLIQ